MEIIQMKYLIAVVENNYNITQAAKSIYISQPGLSKALINIEDNLDFKIFVRNKGRLTGLTEEGEILYKYSKDILYKYNLMKKSISELNEENITSIDLGVPPVVVTLLVDFFDCISHMPSKLKLNILENGAHVLENLLEERVLDFSVLLNSPKIKNENYDFQQVTSDEFAIFLDEKHPLAHKDFLEWTDLTGLDVVVSDKSYQTYHIFMDIIDEYNINLNNIITNYSWSYSFTLIKNTDMVSFLPVTLKNFFNMNGMKAIKFKERVPWDIYFVWRKKEKYSKSEKLLIKLIREQYNKE